MIASLRQRRRGLAAGAAILVVVAIGAAAVFAGPGAGARATSSPSPSAGPSTIAAGTSFGIESATGLPTWLATGLPTGLPTAPGDPTFQPIDVFATPGPLLLHPSEPPGDSIFHYDPGRPIPAQSTEWRTLKASGRIVLSKGKIGLLDADVDPMTNPSTGKPVADARTLDLTWTRWIVEPPASGVDEKGNLYRDLSYWNLCGAGATTVALYYWQQLTGEPNVTGAAGYSLDPYEASGAAWPSRGPSFTGNDGQPQHLGTYWSGTDHVSGFTANGRGFIMYVAMAARPAGWTTPGIAIFVDGLGAPLYPTKGSPRGYIEAGLNWEVSNHNVAGWVETWYTSVSRADPTLARDLTAAVMLDVGRDGVPVVAAVDTFDLPNWQASPASKTTHTRHAIAIVGYDNTANPPTFTYLDTCGRACNSGGGNRNGQIHVISQTQMVKALRDAYGMGFVW